MEKEMSESESIRNPAFQIFQPNPLIGNRSLVIFNPEMSRSLCELIEKTELEPEESHLYAFAKHLRRYYHNMSEMYQEKPEEEPVGV